MITRLTKIQLVAFLVVTLVGVTYVGFRYAGFENLFGSPTYPVRMQMADSGGIFTGADVTYRGVSVGRVGPLTLTAQGVDVQLDINNGAPKIPSDVDAEVHNLSAIGEQYVDLLPRRNEGPFLDESSVIPMDRTKTPVPVETLIVDLDNFVRSVPLDKLRTVVDELGTGFNDTAIPIQQLIDSTDLFTRDALAAMPATLTLIRDGRRVLATQNATAPQFASFSRDLRLLAAQLRESDPDLRRLFDTAPEFSTQLVELLDESGDGIGAVVADLLTVSRIAEPRQAALRQLLVTYPATTTNSYTVTPGDGTAHLGLVLNVFDPPPCVTGYEGTNRRPGNEVTAIPPNEDAHCGPPQGSPGSPTSVRGAQHAPGPSGFGSSTGHGGKSGPHTNATPPPVIDMDSPASILALP